MTSTTRDLIKNAVTSSSQMEKMLNKLDSYLAAIAKECAKDTQNPFKTNIHAKIKAFEADFRRTFEVKAKDAIKLKRFATDEMTSEKRALFAELMEIGDCFNASCPNDISDENAAVDRIERAISNLETRLDLKRLIAEQDRLSLAIKNAANGSSLKKELTSQRKDINASIDAVKEALAPLEAEKKSLDERIALLKKPTENAILKTTSFYAARKVFDAIRVSLASGNEVGEALDTLLCHAMPSFKSFRIMTFNQSLTSTREKDSYAPALPTLTEEQMNHLKYYASGVTDFLSSTERSGEKPPVAIRATATDLGEAYLIEPLIHDIIKAKEDIDNGRPSSMDYALHSNLQTSRDMVVDLYNNSIRMGGGTDVSVGSEAKQMFQALSSSDGERVMDSEGQDVFALISPIMTEYAYTAMHEMRLEVRSTTPDADISFGGNQDIVLSGGCYERIRQNKGGSKITNKNSTICDFSLSNQPQNISNDLSKRYGTNIRFVGVPPSHTLRAWLIPDLIHRQWKALKKIRGVLPIDGFKKKSLADEWLRRLADGLAYRIRRHESYNADAFLRGFASKPSHTRDITETARVAGLVLTQSGIHDAYVHTAFTTILHKALKNDQ